MTATTAASLAALLLGLAWLVLGYWVALRPVGDDVGARLDALTPAEVTEVPAAGRYARFERRDYSADRGPCPQPRRRYASLYDELVTRLGDPLGGASC